MTKELLAEILFDESAPLDIRDDAAMDLADYDEALPILIDFARRSAQPEILTSSCGTSIAEIWRRTGIYDQGIVDSLSKSAQSELRDYFA